LPFFELAQHAGWVAPNSSAVGSWPTTFQIPFDCSFERELLLLKQEMTAQLASIP